jgi:hypothetical protein
MKEREGNTHLQPGENTDMILLLYKAGDAEEWAYSTHSLSH